MNNELDNLLPIGSVCKVKKIDLDIMICGYFFLNKKRELFTYIGVVYPFGVIDNKRYLIFKDIDIEKVIFKGFVGPEFNGLKYGINLGIEKTKDTPIDVVKENIMNNNQKSKDITNIDFVKFKGGNENGY